MDCLKDPEENEYKNDLDVVEGRVLVDTLVIGIINWVVSVSVAFNLGPLNLGWGRVNRSRHLCIWQIKT